MLVLIYSEHKRADGSTYRHALRIVESKELEEKVKTLLEKDSTYERTGKTNPLYRNLRYVFLDHGQQLFPTYPPQKEE